MNYKKRNLIILLILFVTITMLISVEVKQHCGKHFPKAGEVQANETISGTTQVVDNQLQLVQDSTQVVFNLIIPENMEEGIEKIEIGRRYIFSGKSNKSGFVVDKFIVLDASTEGSKHQVDSNKCIGCRLCVNQCPEGAISMVSGKAVINQEKCIDCGICVSGSGRFKGCPVKAIEKK